MRTLSASHDHQPLALAHVTLLHPGHGHEKWRCWLESVEARHIDADRGPVFDTLELTPTAAAEGHGVAIGDPRMARDRLRAATLVTPFIDVAQNGLSYFVVYPSQRAAQSKIRALADILFRRAIGESSPDRDAPVSSWRAVRTPPMPVFKSSMIASRIASRAAEAG